MPTAVAREPDTQVPARPVPAPPARRRTADGRWGGVFLAPWLLGLVLLTLGPMAASVYFSFTDFGLLGSPHWVGGKNYAELLTDDPTYLQSIKVTLVYVGLSVPLKLAIALLVAMVLNTKLRGLSFYRAVFYLPSLLGASVAVAIMWRQLFTGDGVVNRFLAVLGIDAPSWVSNPDYSIYTLVALAAWQFGTPMLIFLAGLQQIPRTLLEAASVDGAGTVSRFFRVTLPLLTPILFFNLVMQVIGSFQAFSQAYVVGDGQGGPAESTLVYSLYLYKAAFVEFKMGYASAIAWVFLLGIAALTAVNFLFSRYWVFYDDEH
ncbi:sugar ABC transporter permease [Kribbella sp. NPDC050459]|uniref:carbohydrate ABC transporter permease n=1 Tax=Kribbella sp. NPDC050459 TaxID=3155785 RepID=UPI0033D15981